MFAIPFPVYDGKFEARVNCDYSFPFQATFPAAGEGVLPPTFGSHFSDYPDVVDVAVYYQLGAKVEMPGIEIKVQVPEGELNGEFRVRLPGADES